MDKITESFRAVAAITSFIPTENQLKRMMEESRQSTRKGMMSKLFNNLKISNRSNENKSEEQEAEISLALKIKDEISKVTSSFSNFKNIDETYFRAMSGGKSSIKSNEEFIKNILRKTIATMIQGNFVTSSSESFVRSDFKSQILIQSAMGLSKYVSLKSRLQFSSSKRGYWPDMMSLSSSEVSSFGNLYSVSNNQVYRFNKGMEFNRLSDPLDSMISSDSFVSSSSSSAITDSLKSILKDSDVSEEARAKRRADLEEDLIRSKREERKLRDKMYQHALQKAKEEDDGLKLAMDDESDLTENDGYAEVAKLTLRVNELKKEIELDDKENLEKKSIVKNIEMVIESIMLNLFSSKMSEETESELRNLASQLSRDSKEFADVPKDKLLSEFLRRLQDLMYENEHGSIYMSDAENAFSETEDVINHKKFENIVVYTKQVEAPVEISLSDVRDFRADPYLDAALSNEHLISCLETWRENIRENRNLNEEGLDVLFRNFITNVGRRDSLNEILSLNDSPQELLKDLCQFWNMNQEASSDDVLFMLENLENMEHNLTSGSVNLKALRLRNLSSLHEMLQDLESENRYVDNGVRDQCIMSMQLNRFLPTRDELKSFRRMSYENLEGRMQDVNSIRLFQAVSSCKRRLRDTMVIRYGSTHPSSMSNALMSVMEDLVQDPSAADSSSSDLIDLDFENFDYSMLDSIGNVPIKIEMTDLEEEDPSSDKFTQALQDGMVFLDVSYSSVAKQNYNNKGKISVSPEMSDYLFRFHTESSSPFFKDLFQPNGVDVSFEQDKLTIIMADRFRTDVSESSDRVKRIHWVMMNNRLKKTEPIRRIEMKNNKPRRVVNKL